MMITQEIAPWIILAFVAVYGLLHSFLASIGVKIRAKKWFGDTVYRSYRLLYNLIAVITLIPVLSLKAFLPDQTLYVIPYPINLLTITIQLCASIALAVGLLNNDVWSFIGIRQLISSSSDEDSQMIVKGLYRYVQHPLYAAGLLLIWFTPLMTSNLLALNIGFTIYILVGMLFEERKLKQIFGNSYLEYARSTPRLIPKIF